MQAARIARASVAVHPHALRRNSAADNTPLPCNCWGQKLHRRDSVRQKTLNERGSAPGPRRPTSSLPSRAPPLRNDHTVLGDGPRRANVWSKRTKHLHARLLAITSPDSGLTPRGIPAAPWPPTTDLMMTPGRRGRWVELFPTVAREPEYSPPIRSRYPPDRVALIGLEGIVAYSKRKKKETVRFFEHRVPSPPARYCSPNVSQPATFRIVRDSTTVRHAFLFVVGRKDRFVFR